MTFCDQKFISKPIFLLQPKWFEKEKREGATAEYSSTLVHLIYMRLEALKFEA